MTMSRQWWARMNPSPWLTEKPSRQCRCHGIDHPITDDQAKAMAWMERMGGKIWGRPGWFKGEDWIEPNLRVYFNIGKQSCPVYYDVLKHEWTDDYVGFGNALESMIELAAEFAGPPDLSLWKDRWCGNEHGRQRLAEQRLAAIEEQRVLNQAMAEEHRAIIQKVEAMRAESHMVDAAQAGPGEHYHERDEWDEDHSIWA